MGNNNLKEDEQFSSDKKRGGALFKYGCVSSDHQPRLDAWDKCLGLVHWEDPEGSGREGAGRGFGMGNTCKSMADSCQCMTKPTTIL